MLLHLEKTSSGFQGSTTIYGTTHLQFLFLVDPAWSHRPEQLCASERPQDVPPADRGRPRRQRGRAAAQAAAAGEGAQPAGAAGAAAGEAVGGGPEAEAEGGGAERNQGGEEGAGGRGRRDQEVQGLQRSGGSS